MSNFIIIKKNDIRIIVNYEIISKDKKINLKV